MGEGVGVGVCVDGWVGRWVTVRGFEGWVERSTDR